MLKLEDDLKKHLNDDRKFNNISSEILSKTEKRKIQLLKKEEKIRDACQCKRLLYCGCQ